MAKISAYSQIPTVAKGDWIPVVDVSDLSMASTGTTKKATPQQILQAAHKVYINQYGADPTGATSSDAAWNAAYTDAQAAVQTLTGSSATTGAIIIFGAGIYTFSINTVSIGDARIGLIGAGRGATLIRTTGNTGYLLNISGGAEPAGVSSAPVGGFDLYGWDGGNTVDGMRYGDRDYGYLFDVGSRGFNGTSSTGFRFASTGLIEGTDAVGLRTASNTVGCCFDTGSFDYSRFNVHTVTDGTAVQLINGAHCWGGLFALHGNIGSALFANPTLMQIGTGVSDTAKFSGTHLHLSVEADSGSTTIKDFVIAGAGGNSGLLDCYGTINLLSASGTYTAGSLNTAPFQFTGPITGSPLVTSLAGNKYQIGHVLTSFDSTSTAGRIDAVGAIEYSADSVQTIASGNTIKTNTNGRFGLVPLSAAAAVTGVVLEAPSRTNTEITCINRSANSITFAASGTSHVADGASDVIAANHAAKFAYDATSALWYRI